MNFKKIIASVAAAALAVSAMAVNAFASTVTLDSDYVGDWGSGATIAKTEFDAFEGDVKVVLTVETVNVSDGNSYLIKPMDKDKSWDAITSSLTTAKGVCKPDGWMQVRADQTEVEFVVSKDVKESLWNAGIGFQVNNVIIKSAELSDGTAEKAFTIVSDADTPAYCSGKLDPWPAEEETTAAPAEEATTEEAAPAEDTAAAEDTDEALDDTADAADDEVAVDDVDADTADDVVTTDDAAADEAVVDAPAADADTAAAATGNTSAAVIFSVMAVAGAAAIVAKKRK